MCPVGCAITANSRLCSIHFDEHQFENKIKTRSRLVYRAVPTRVFLADGTLSECSQRNDAHDSDPTISRIDLSSTTIHSKVSEEDIDHDSRYGVINWDTLEDRYVPTTNELFLPSISHQAMMKFILQLMRTTLWVMTPFHYRTVDWLEWIAALLSWLKKQNCWEGWPRLWTRNIG